MMKLISRLVTAAAAGLFIAGAASAATVNFTLQSATIEIGTPTDNVANIRYFVIPNITPDAVNPTSPLPLNLEAVSTNRLLDLFLFKGLGTDNSEDSFTLTAKLVIDIIGELSPITYTFTGNVTEWLSAGGNVRRGAIDWGNPIADPNSNALNLALSDINLFTSSRPDGVVTSLVYRAIETSVVPLPGGILLLGSALLGIFGLSRRRNCKLAAA